jgi:hypothetical protein
MYGVWEVVRVEEDEPHPVALLDSDGGARHASDRGHALAFRCEHPEFHELPGVDLLRDLDHLKPDGYLVWVAVAVKVASQDERLLRGARDARFRPVLGRAAGGGNCRDHQRETESGRNPSFQPKHHRPPCPIAELAVL